MSDFSFLSYSTLRKCELQYCCSTSCQLASVLMFININCYFNCICIPKYNVSFNFNDNDSISHWLTTLNFLQSKLSFKSSLASYIGYCVSHRQYMYANYHFVTFLVEQVWCDGNPSDVYFPSPNNFKYKLSTKCKMS